MVARANEEWQKWGELDPLFGVASWGGKGVGDANSWTEEEFYALGEADWADFLSHWRRYGLEPGTCVEIGCGAARLTRPMGAFFDHVHGVDVAPGMLARAASAVGDLPITLHQTDGLTLPFADQSADAVFSTHVFQHFDSLEDAAANWAEIARILRPGGSVMVHLPVHMWPGGLERLQAVYLARRTLGDWRARIKRRQMARGRAAPIMRGQCYAYPQVETTLRGLGLVDVELSVFRVTSNDGLHPFVFARKPAG